MMLKDGDGDGALPEMLTGADSRSRPKKNSVAVENELKALHKRRGTITIDLVYQHAKKHKKGPIGQRLDWNDTYAAEQWRLDQIRQILMSSVIARQIVQSREARAATLIGEVKAVEVRNLVNAFDDGRFKLRAEALEDASWRPALIEKYKERLRSWCREVCDIEELAELRELILSKL